LEEFSFHDSVTHSSLFAGSESEVDSLTASLETLDIRSTSTTFAGACERVANGALSRPMLSQFERMEAKDSEEKIRSEITPVPVCRSPPPALEPEGEEIFEDSNVFGVVGRTPSTEELLRVGSLSGVPMDLNCVGFDQIERLPPTDPSPPQRRSPNSCFLAVQVHVGHHPGGQVHVAFLILAAQRVLAENGIGSSRIDGSVSGYLDFPGLPFLTVPQVCGKDRQRVIDAMNDVENGGVDVCLLTTRACG
jgi:hypothetical protein